MVLHRFWKASRIVPSRVLEQLLMPTAPRVTPLQAIAAVRGNDPSGEEQCRDVIRREAIVLHQRGFPSQLEVRTSTIQDAGHGVFAASNLDAGQVLGTYGGLYIPPIPVCGSPEPFLEPKHLMDIKGNYIYCCEGGGWIDGKEHLRAQTQGWHDVVQLVNHGTRPNSIAITVHDFPLGLGVDAPKEGTPWYFSPEDASIVTIPRHVVLKGVVLVSLRDIELGEELIFDYGINPQKDRPEWYEPVPHDYLDKIVAMTRYQ